MIGDNQTEDEWKARAGHELGTGIFLRGDRKYMLPGVSYEESLFLLASGRVKVMKWVPDSVARYEDMRDESCSPLGDNKDLED